MRRIPIMLVDDHPIVAEGVGALLAAEADLHLCHVAHDAASALAAQAACPHRLAIVDVALGRDSGLWLVMEMKRRWPELLVLVYSLYDSQLYARDALAAGASAYLTKQEAPKVLLLAIRRLLAGGRWRLPRTQKHPELQSLSEREQEVLRLIGQGLVNREVAERLRRSVKTVESHRENIKKKLGLTSSGDLLRYALLWVEGRAWEDS